MVSESNGHRGGSSSCLQGSLDQRGPDDWSGCGGCSRLDVVCAVRHFSVMLHNLLDDLILLVVKDS